MVKPMIIKSDPGAGGSGEGGGRGGGEGDGKGEPGNKRIKTDPDGKGGGGGDGDGEGGDGDGSGGGSPNQHVRTGDCPAPPSDLVLVGRILDCPSPSLQRAAGGKMIEVHVETWMTDLYRSAHWWIELPNVEDVGDVNRGKLKVKAVPLCFTVSSLVAVENASQGRMRLEGIRLALFGNSGDDSGRRSSGWEMISGTPPAWFAQVWDGIRYTGDAEDPPSESAQTRFVDEFKHAKLYLSQAQVLQAQRDWLLV